LIGGSPCQGFSMAGHRRGSSTVDGVEVTTLKQYKKLKKQGFEFDGQSYLFWEFVRIWQIIKPKYFLLENVRVTKQWLPMFNKAMGVEPHFINSSLVSAQNRPRFYWTNIKMKKMPKDKGIILRDILDDIEFKTDNPPKIIVGDFNGKPRYKKHLVSDINKDKACCISAGNVHPNKYIIDMSVKPSVAKNIKVQHDGIIDSDKDFFTMPCTSGFQDNKVGLKKSPCLRAGNSATYILQHTGDAIDIKWNDSQKRIYSAEGKSPAVMTQVGGNKEIKVNQPTQLMYRKLLPRECARLQTIPDWYEFPVSNTQFYKMVGNGFTINVIAHLLKGMK